MTYSKSFGAVITTRDTEWGVEHRQTTLCVCEDCGSVVAEKNQYLHDVWHYQVEMRSDIED